MTPTFATIENPDPGTTPRPPLRATSRLEYAYILTGSAAPVGIVLGVIVFEGFVGLTAMLWLLDLCMHRRNPLTRLRQHPLFYPWVCWYGCVLLSAINGVGTWADMGEDVLQVRFLLYGLALLDVAERVSLARYLLNGLMIGLALALVNMAAAHLWGYDIVGKPLIRYISKQKEASRIAGMAAYAAPFFLAWALLTVNIAAKHRFLLLVACLGSFVALFMLHIRTTIIAAGTAALLPVVWFVARNPRRHAGLALVVIVVVSTTLGLFFSRQHYRKPAQLYYRVAIWKVSWDLWTEHPWTGTGINAYRAAYRDHFQKTDTPKALVVEGETYTVPEAYHTHNLILMVLTCTGIVGLSIFGWLFCTASRLVWRLRSVDPWRHGLLIWPPVLLLLGLTGYNVFDSWYNTLLAFFLVMIGSSWWQKTPEADLGSNPKTGCNSYRG